VKEVRILAADDEPMVHSLLRRALGFPPYRLVSAQNGDEALRAAREERPDLILLDLGMPGKDGRQVLRELRRERHTRTVPVLILSGESGLADKVEGFELGADDYITKPFEVDELRARVKGALHRSQRDLSANPLTRLPGSPALNDELSRLIREDTPFAFHYVDIDNFKAFNDSYGYAMGDFVIQETARLLLEAVTGHGSPEDLVAHIGGDDFALVTRLDAAEGLARFITEEFDRRAPSFYNATDRERGYIESKDRQGNPRRFPFVSLTLAMTDNRRRRILHPARAADLAAEIKRSLKSRPDRRGSAYLMDRRRDEVPA
jgi:PleD family two-component response regulator